MLDDLFDSGEFAIGRAGQPGPAQRVVRVVVGVFGAALCLVGAGYIALRPESINPVLRTNMAAIFVLLGCFSLFNVALARRWRWPLRLFVVSFLTLFLVRILFGR